MSDLLEEVLRVVLVAEKRSLAMQRLQRPLPDRRSKRAHIRSWLIRPSPNQHSQLFISLRDVGRRYPY